MEKAGHTKNKVDESVFTYDNYKKYLAHQLIGPANRGQLSRAATYMNCQRSFLSRVISEHLHLTPDHAYLMGQFLKLTEAERQYFTLLVEFERAGHIDYKNHIKTQITKIKKAHDSIQERTQRTNITTENIQIQYFATWLTSAIHFLTAIPEFRTEQALAQRLNCSIPQVKFSLNVLQQMGFVENLKGKWTYKNGDFHLPKSSPLVILHHQNWRHRAVSAAQDFEANNVHFTGILTLSQRDRERLRELILSFIADANKISDPSQPEEAMILCCDYYKA